MKKNISVIIISTMIFLMVTGCMQQNQTVKEVEDTIDLVIDNTVYYNRVENDLPEIVLKKDQEEKIISEGSESPSQPFISPNKKKLVYIAPYEFEIVGEVFLYNVLEDSKEAIISHNDIPENLSPKKICWFDDRYLLCIMGFAYGSISKGGDLYVYDTVDGKLTLLVKEDDTNREVIDISVEQNKVKLSTAVFNDKFTDYTIDELSYEQAEFLDLIEKK